MIHDKVDLEAAFEDDGSCYRLYNGDWDCYLDAEEHEFRLLAKLMDDTLIYMGELIEVFP